MADRISKLQRWIDLIAYHSGRRLPVTVEQIMEAMPAYRERWRSGDDTARASLRRAFERDKKGLRDAGIGIETVDFTVDGLETEGYRLRDRDFYLPYIRLVSEIEETRGAAAGGSTARTASPDEGFHLEENELRAAAAGLRTARAPGTWWPTARTPRTFASSASTGCSASGAVRAPLPCPTTSTPRTTCRGPARRRTRAGACTSGRRRPSRRGRSAGTAVRDPWPHGEGKVDAPALHPAALPQHVGGDGDRAELDGLTLRHPLGHELQEQPLGLPGEWDELKAAVRSTRTGCVTSG